MLVEWRNSTVAPPKFSGGRSVVRRTVLTAFAIVMAMGTMATSAKDATPGANEASLLRIRWQLESITAADGTTRHPPDQATHTIQFLPEGHVAIRADCNSGSGDYTITDGSLAIERMVTTLVGCPSGPFASDYAAALSAATGFAVGIGDDASDHLTITTADGATLVFTPSLQGVVWQFTRFQAGNGEETVVDDPSRYTLEVFDDGSARVRADCNRGKGRAVIDGSAIDLTVALTRSACPPGSLSSEYAGYLDEAVSWVIRDGQLHLSLPIDAGIASFRSRLDNEGDSATPAS
jgi:heat shock protein HslJ